MKWLFLLVMLPLGVVAQQVDVLRWVDPFIGTAKSQVYTKWGNEGGTYPGAVAPSGYMQLSPETRWGAFRGYDRQDSLIYVFSCTHHSSGFPGGSAGRFFVMPGGVVRGRPFRRFEERAEPGYYRVKFSDDGTEVEAVATVRAGEFRMQFPEGVKPEIFVGDTADAFFDFSEKYIDRKVVEGGEVFSFAGHSIVVRVGSSGVGMESAKRNVLRECAGGFDSMRLSVARQWRKALSVVEVDDPFADKTVFYTALYHSLLVPWVVSDVDGYYRGADGVAYRVQGRNEYGNFSPWDSYRSLHPLLSLLYPGKQSEMVLSMLDEYREGGHLPTESMTGNHAVAIVADAFLKGVKGIDPAVAYKAMLRSVIGAPFLQDDRKIYGDSGYIPLTFSESVTRTVEYGYDDWVLARYAREVAHDPGMSAMLLKRSMAYQHLLYLPSLLLLPRDGDSVRVHPGNSGYKEGDAWVYSYFAPQDPYGLIDQMGGEKDFAARLDSALDDGRIVFDNETVEHLPYFFNFAGRHDLTVKWVCSIMTQRYSKGSGGLPGNDDLGAMSSWFVFSAMGFYPFRPGDPRYTIGAPFFRRLAVHLANGKQLVVQKKEGRGELSFNGRDLADHMELSHAAMMNGGELVFGDGILVRPIVREKPLFVLSDIKLAATELRPGEMSRIQFSLTNKGVTGSKRVLLSVGGDIVGSVNCKVGAGRQVVDSIFFRVYKAGHMSVSLDGEDAGMVDVAPAPGQVLPDPEVAFLPMRVLMKEGDSLRLRYRVKNTGWVRQVFPMRVLIDGEFVDTDSVLMSAGQERTRSLSLFGGKAGWHILEIGSRTMRFKVYGSAADAVVLDLDPVFKDRSGFGNNGIKEGRLERLGLSDYIRIPGSPSLADMGERLTMLLWVYPEGDEHRGLVDIFTNGDNHVLQVSDGRQLSFFAGGWGRGDCTVDLPADWKGRWHLIAGTCDQKGLTVYIDGVKRGYTPVEKAVHLFAGDNTWMIGRNEEFPGQRIFEGAVRRPMIFQEALSAEEILRLYNQGNNLP